MFFSSIMNFKPWPLYSVIAFEWWLFQFIFKGSFTLIDGNDNGKLIFLSSWIGSIQTMGGVHTGGHQQQWHKATAMASSWNGLDTHLRWQWQWHSIWFHCILPLPSPQTPPQCEQSWRNISFPLPLPSLNVNESYGFLWIERHSGQSNTTKRSTSQPTLLGMYLPTSHPKPNTSSDEPQSLPLSMLSIPQDIPWCSSAMSLPITPLPHHHHPTTYCLGLGMGFNWFHVGINSSHIK